MPPLSTLNTTLPLHPRILALRDPLSDALTRKKKINRRQKAALLARLHAISIRQFHGQPPVLPKGRRKVVEYVPAHLKATRVKERVVGIWRGLRGKGRREVVVKRVVEVCKTMERVVVQEEKGLEVMRDNVSFSPLPELPPLPLLSDLHPIISTKKDEPPMALKQRIPKITFAPLPNPLAPPQRRRPQFLCPHTPLLPILKRTPNDDSKVQSGLVHPAIRQMNWEELREFLPKPRPHPYLAPLAKRVQEEIHAGIRVCPTFVNWEFVGDMEGVEMERVVPHLMDNDITAGFFQNQNQEQLAAKPRWQPWMIGSGINGPAFASASTPVQVGFAQSAPPPNMEYSHPEYMHSGQFQGNYMGQMQMRGQFPPSPQMEGQMRFQHQNPFPPPGFPLGQELVAPNLAATFRYPEVAVAAVPQAAQAPTPPSTLETGVDSRLPQIPFSRQAPLLVSRLPTEGLDARVRLTNRGTETGTVEASSTPTAWERVFHRDEKVATRTVEAPDHADIDMDTFFDFSDFQEQSEANNIHEAPAAPMRQVQGFQNRDAEVIEMNGSDSPGEAEPPRPAGRQPDPLHGMLVYMLVSDNTSMEVKSRGPEESKILKRWFFIPDEVEELYAGDRWPDLYSYLGLKSYCDSSEILPVFEKQIREHFPVLSKPYKHTELSKLVQYLRYLLKQLPSSEMVKFISPYQSFRDILKAYRKEWEDWANRPRKGNGAPHNKFEEVLLAFIILSNPHYRERYDTDRETKDPYSDHNMFFCDLPHEPDYQIKLVQNAHGIEIEKGLANVGIWISKEHKDCMDMVKNDVLNRLLSEHISIDPLTEDLEWKYHNGTDFYLMQTQQRKCRTGWWAEIEKLADASLKRRANKLLIC